MARSKVILAGRPELSTPPLPPDAARRSRRMTVGARRLSLADHPVRLMATTCPDPERLARFAVGALPAADLDHVAAHVECCPDCEATLLTLDATPDPFVAGLRGSNVDTRVPPILLDAARSVIAPPHPKQIGPFELLEE